MRVCITGHRPEKCEAEEVVRGKFRDVLSKYRPEVVIVGMAPGCDLWAGSESLSLGLEVWAVRPWAGHGPRIGSEALYASVLSGASKVVNVSDKMDFPGNRCYQARNEWMVDHATHVLAYWNGEHSGTGNCIKYANQVGKPVRNIYA